MNYRIILDETILKEFIAWLPELNENEKYYYCLFARSKYAKGVQEEKGLPDLTSGKAQLKRGLSTKEKLFDKISQLEVAEGLYRQRGAPIPQEALALYLAVNPRDLRRAAYNSISRLAQCLRDDPGFGDPHQEVLSEIQRTKGTTHYIDFDLDLEGARLREAMDQIRQVAGEEAITWLQTRGGVHCLIRPGLVPAENKNRLIPARSDTW